MQSCPRRLHGIMLLTSEMKLRMTDKNVSRSDLIKKEDEDTEDPTESVSPIII